MIAPIVVRKGRTNIVQVALGLDVSTDVFSSEIRTKEDPDSDLLASWTCSFATDGTDGELVLTLDYPAEPVPDFTYGFMDLKRVSGVRIFNVFSESLPVVIKDVVTE